MTPHDLLGELEAQRSSLVARLDALPPDVLARAPAEGAWSLAQIVDHLARIDASLRPDGPPASVLVRSTSATRCCALRGVLHLPLRIPAPAGAASVMPSHAPDYASVRDAWAARRADWRWRLLGVSPDAVVFRHPLMGPFVPQDALAFLLAHHRHHDAQVERTLRSVGR